MKKAILLIAVVSGMLFAGWGAPQVRAVSLNVSGGILLGASGVDVLGTSYEVTFKDGSCVGLFGGCDEVSDFDFTDFTSALAAAQSLADQVFIDSAVGLFDTQPVLTSGCGTASVCITLIPYDPVGSSIDPNVINATGVVNAADETADDLAVNQINKLTDYSSNPNINFARFTAAAAPPAPTPVPEPSTWILMSSGLACLFFWQRRKQKTA